MKVLYIDGVGPFGGASRSLYEAVKALPPGEVQPHFLAVRGTALDYYRQIATDIVSTRGITRFDNTLYSHYRGLRWLILLREAGYVPFSVEALIRAKQRWGAIDVIHANEVLELFVAIAAKRLFSAPLVVHVRSVQNANARSNRYHIICNLLRRFADKVIAIDENVRASLPADIDVSIIHNSFTPKAAAVPDVSMIQKLEALPPDSLKVGFVGNLHHSKGLFEMQGAARIMAETGRQVDFVIVGGTTISDEGSGAAALSRSGLAQNVRQELSKRAQALGISNRFHLMGPTNDIQNVYNRIDVICFASHFNAPGRPIFEAAFAGVPSIAAITNPLPDTIVPYETGVAVAPKDDKGLATAIAHFADNRGEVARMGENARRLANANFDPVKNSVALLELYKTATSND